MSELNAMHANHQAFWRHMARSTGGTVHEDADCLLVATGVAAAPFNQVHCRATDSSAAVEKAAAFFGERGLPWRIVSEVPDPRAGGYAGRRGVAQEPLYPIMSLDLTSLAADPPDQAGLSVSVARSVEDLREFIECAGASFGHDPELIEAMCRPETVADDDFRLYLGRVDDRCVAISVGVSVREQSTVGVYFVGVRPEARGLGYGRAVTEQVVADGVARGARTAVLQATPAGYPVYAKMGFTQVGDYHLWDFTAAPAIAG